MSPHIFIFRFCIWRGFKTKSIICHILCEELFMFDVTHSQVGVETEFGVVSLTLIVLYILVYPVWYAARKVIA